MKDRGVGFNSKLAACEVLREVLLPRVLGSYGPSHGHASNASEHFPKYFMPGSEQGRMGYLTDLATP